MILNVNYSGKTYLLNGIPVRQEVLIERIKDGDEVEGKNDYGQNNTMEILTRLAFREFFTSPKQAPLADFISLEIDEETLYRIIQSGDLRTYLERRNRHYYSTMGY